MTKKTNYRIILILGLLLLTAATISSSSAANTIFVNNATGNDSHDGLTVVTAKATIQNGTDTVSDGGTVNVADGTYQEFVNIQKNLTLIGQSQSNTIIDGTNTGRPLTIYLGQIVNIINFTIKNGISTNGGGINNKGDLTITNTTIKENRATSTGEEVYGGGIYNEGTLTINNSTITNNTATGTDTAYGGGIYNSGTLIITNNTITNNSATTTNGYADGGGISNEYGTLTINNSTITKNFAIGTNGAYGGGISNSFLGNLTINNSSITNNTATALGRDVYGGGISNWGAFLTINNSTITGNTATATNGITYGGGISNNGDLTITDTTLKDNTASSTGEDVYGGGIYNGETLTVVKCSFENNNAGVGGGIFNQLGTLNVSASTFQNNKANYGGGIANTGTATVINTIFTSNNANRDGGALNTNGALNNINFLNVTNCTITSNTAQHVAGGIMNWYGNLKVISSTLTNNTASMEGNAISNYGPAENNVPVELHFNRITGNGEYTLYSNSNMLNATDNWWGSNNPNFSTIISGVVNYTPWMYLTFTAAPLSIPQGSTSSLTASFNQDTDGTTITQINPLVGHIPDGTPVTFTTDLGNVGSKSVVKYTLNGIATAILRADEAAGSALVSAFLDSQTPLTRTVIITPVANALTTTSTTTTVQAANTIGMQTTGAPLVQLAIAIFSVLGGLAATRRKIE